MRGVPWVIAHLYMTLDPSRRLRRLSPVRAARPSRFTAIEHVLSSAVGHAVRASFLVVFQRTPLHRHTQFASCPGSPKRGPFGLTLLHARLLPPLPFLPTSVVYSAHCATGLLHPVASHEVRAVSGRACCHCVSTMARFPCLSLARSSYPPKCSPLQKPCHVSVVVTVSPLRVRIVSNPRLLNLTVLLLCRMRCGPSTFPLPATRYSLGLCSPSRRSPRNKCSVE